MTLLMKWCFSRPYSRFSPSCSCSGMLWCVYWCGYQIFLAICIALTYKDIWFFPCVIGYPSLSEVDCATKSVVLVHILGQRVRFLPTLLRPHRLALISKTPVHRCCRVEARWYILMDLLSSQSLTWFGLSSNQTQSQVPSWWCFTYGVSPAYIFMSLVWPIFLPCSYSRLSHLIGVS